MRQLTCTRPDPLPEADRNIPGALHPPVPAGQPNGGLELVVLPVPDDFDEATLPPGWRVLERLKDDGLFLGFRADMADLRPFAPDGAAAVADFSWIPIPMGW